MSARDLNEETDLAFFTNMFHINGTVIRRIYPQLIAILAVCCIAQYASDLLPSLSLRSLLHTSQPSLYTVIRRGHCTATG